MSCADGSKTTRPDPCGNSIFRTSCPVGPTGLVDQHGVRARALASTPRRHQAAPACLLDPSVDGRHRYPGPPSEIGRGPARGGSDPLVDRPDIPVEVIVSLLPGLRTRQQRLPETDEWSERGLVLGKDLRRTLARARRKLVQDVRRSSRVIAFLLDGSLELGADA